MNIYLTGLKTFENKILILRTTNIICFQTTSTFQKENKNYLLGYFSVYLSTASSAYKKAWSDTANTDFLSLAVSVVWAFARCQCFINTNETFSQTFQMVTDKGTSSVLTSHKKNKTDPIVQKLGIQITPA